MNDEGQGLPHARDEQPSDLLTQFHRAAQSDPHAVAVHTGGRSLTRTELDVSSDALAMALLALGVRRGDRVAVYLQNCPEFVIAILAAWRAGCSVVPGNPMHRVREFQTIMDDSGARIVIAPPDFVRDVVTAAQRRLDIIVVEQDDTDTYPLTGSGDDGTVIQGFADLVTAGPERPPAQYPDLEDPAFITYTSGTTGKPRGAINSHRAMAYAGAAYQSCAALTARDVILGTAPMFHITGLAAGLAASITSGAPLVLHGRFETQRVADLIRTHGATFMLATITVFIAFMTDSDVSPDSLRTLRKVFTGGAPVAPELAQRWQKMFGSPLGTGYGLTETSGPSHLSPLFTPVPTDAASGALAVGKAVPDMSATILRDDGSVAGVGEEGEVVLAGPQLMTGYWNDREATAQTYPDHRLRTGDIGLIDESGWLYLIDRKKDVIVASGFKVWPREVEDALYELPAIREAAVIGAPDPYRGETVIAYVSLRAGHHIDEDSIIAYCRHRLANYKRPSRVVILDELPKTGSGKIRRVDLRDQLQ